VKGGGRGGGRGEGKVIRGLALGMNGPCFVLHGSGDDRLWQGSWALLYLCRVLLVLVFVEV
jgi:hypothetical protein